MLTVPVNQGLDQFTSVQLVVVVSVVHLEVMELQLLIGHLAGIDWNVHVLSDVTRNCANFITKVYSSPSSPTHSFSLCRSPV